MAAPMAKMRWNVDLRGLDNIEKDMEKTTENNVHMAADALAELIDSNWSTSAPSSPGQPPAVRDEDLRNSIRVEQARNPRGQFSKAFSVVVEAEYGAALEFGYSPNNLKPRPFVRPAVLKMQTQIAGFFVNTYKVRSRYLLPV